MDAYPPEYAAHEYPLVLLSGLIPDTKEQKEQAGPVVESSLPVVRNGNASEILHDFLTHQANDTEWNLNRGKLIGYHFKLAGRVSNSVS
jgi:hypothetical protein